jgi:hypothetical protein
MDLHFLGHHIQSRLDSSQLKIAPTKALTSTRILHAQTIEVLWLSWCDTIVRYQESADMWRTMYLGTGLIHAQADHLANAREINDTVSETRDSIEFFGGAMHDGLRGYVFSQGSSNQVVLFATDLEMEAGVSEVEVYAVDEDLMIPAIRMKSGGSILVSTKSLATGKERVLNFEDLAELRAHLKSGFTDSPSVPIAGHFTPSQWCTNSTTAVAIDSAGRLFTAAHDLRYPTCLGRPCEDSTGFEPVPYLSEICIEKIACGGYLAAAASYDGELFTWGQACPGSQGQLSVRSRISASDDTEDVSSTTGIFDDLPKEDQDDLIKLLTIQINSQVARVSDVAIGHGHIWVAAEAQGSDGVIERCVFAAGDNSSGQLGLGTERKFVEEFEEVTWLRDKKVVQLNAAAWSTSIVTVE